MHRSQHKNKSTYIIILEKLVTKLLPTKQIINFKALINVPLFIISNYHYTISWLPKAFKIRLLEVLNRGREG